MKYRVVDLSNGAKYVFTLTQLKDYLSRNKFFSSIQINRIKS